MLTDDKKTKRMGSALKFLTRYSQEGDEFLDSIVTGDEHGVLTALLNPSSSHCDGPIRIPSEPKKFKGQAADCYDSGIQKLVLILNKCLDNNTGDYVEK
jgi:hypothetical protein